MNVYFSTFPTIHAECRFTILAANAVTFTISLAGVCCGP
jgi:hypothetical protein